MEIKIITHSTSNKNFSFIDKFIFRRTKLKDKELIRYFQSVCEFFCVYESILQCLEAALHNITYQRIGFIGVLNNTKKGMLFSTALEKSNLVSGTLINVIKAGEKNNDLPGSFRLIVDFLSNKQQKKGDFIRVLFYPVFSLFVFFVTMLSFSRYILPSLTSLLLEINPESVHRFVFARFVFGIIEKSFFFLFATTAFFAVLFHIDRQKFERLCLKIPFLRSFFVATNMYFLSYYIYTSLSNNLSLDEALEVAIDSTDSVFKDLLRSVKNGFQKGNELSCCFKKSSMIPKVFVDLIKTGEQSNNLTNSFKVATNLFKKELDDFAENFVCFFPVLLLSFISLLLIILVCFLLLPLYNFSV